MNINVKFEYIEKYLPTPRCRKYRTREVKGICTVTVREAPIGKMVPAFGVEQYIWEETPHIENDVIFSNEGSLWKLSRASRLNFLLAVWNPTVTKFTISTRIQSESRRTSRAKLTVS